MDASFHSLSKMCVQEKAKKKAHESKSYIVHGHHLDIIIAGIILNIEHKSHENGEHTYMYSSSVHYRADTGLLKGGPRRKVRRARKRTQIF